MKFTKSTLQTRYDNLIAHLITLVTDKITFDDILSSETNYDYLSRELKEIAPDLWLNYVIDNENSYKAEMMFFSHCEDEPENLKILLKAMYESVENNCE